MQYEPIPGTPPSRNPTHPRFRTPAQITALRFLHRNWYKPNMRGFKAIPTYKKGRHGILKNTGWMIVRVDPDGERLPRARTLVPGRTGKQTRRKLKADLRRQRADANRA